MKTPTRKIREPRRAAKSAVVADPPPYIRAPATVRVFRSGSSQAVGLPKEFRLESSEVQIFWRDDDIVLREKRVKLSERLSSLPPLHDDALPDEIPDWAK
jgi:antitoxin VapB